MANYAYYDQMDAYHAQQAVVNNYHAPYTGEENNRQHGSRTFYASGHKRSQSRRPESPSGPRVFRQLNGTPEADPPQAYSNSKRYLYSNAVQAPDSSRHDRTMQQEERPNPKQILAKVGLSCSSKSELGSGRYSKVLRATYVATKTKMAVKVIDLSTVTPEFRDKFLPREIESWKRVRHVNICSLYQEFQSKDYQFLIMELADHGDMLTHVQQNGAIPEPQALEWMRQLMSGVDHLHRLGVCHRDLKLENVLLFKHGIVKLADFGFAREISSRELSSTYCGSKSYSAPEILKGIRYDAFKADVW